MFILLFFLFAILPIAELAVLIRVGVRIGVLNTVILTLIISAVGAWLARWQGFLVLTKIQDTLNRGLLPSVELIDGFLILAGGVLLLTPGFITDCVGLCLLFPPTRSLIRLLLRKKLENMTRNGQTVHITTFGGRRGGHYKDIDVN